MDDTGSFEGKGLLGNLTVLVHGFSNDNLKEHCSVDVIYCLLIQEPRLDLSKFLGSLDELTTGEQALGYEEIQFLGFLMVAS